MFRIIDTSIPVYELLSASASAAVLVLVTLDCEVVVARRFPEAECAAVLFS